MLSRRGPGARRLLPGFARGIDVVMGENSAFGCTWTIGAVRGATGSGAVGVGGGDGPLGPPPDGLGLGPLVAGVVRGGPVGEQDPDRPRPAHRLAAVPAAVAVVGRRGRPPIEHPARPGRRLPRLATRAAPAGGLPGRPPHRAVA